LNCDFLNYSRYNDAGSITVGAVDSENCNPKDYKFAPLLQPKNKWATKILGIKVGNKTLNIKATKLEVNMTQIGIDCKN
jgi:hypothetical protein